MLWMKTRTYKELGFIASLLFYTASISVAEDAVLPRIESAECVSEQLRAAGADCDCEREKEKAKAKAKA